jgi:GNAT superfamily N-acetyltransferase
VESVRAATPDDLATVVGLAADFVAEQRRARGGPMWEASDGGALRGADTLRAAIDDPTKLVLVGRIDEVVVGMLLATLEALDDGSLLAVIRGLYVEPQGRQVGVGSALLDAAVAWATAKGCRGIDATVLPGNREGKNFFEMHGMVARAIQVHRPVGEE